MDRRGFLGVLASLPIVASFKQVPEKALENVSHNIIKDPQILTNCSGVFTHMDWNLTYGSGTIPHCSG